MAVSATTSELVALQPYLTAREKELIERLLPTGSTWSPLPGPQRDAYDSLADELFYGGAAGGGKTDLLLGLAGTRHHRAIIFRREFPQLRGIIERSRELFGSTGKYNQTDHVWRLPDGRMLELGAVERDDSVNKYQGRPHDLKAFDELPNFTEAQYRFLIGWARTTKPGQRVRIVGAGNPPTNSDGEWVIRRWAPWLDDQHPNPASPGELRWFAVVDGVEREVESGEPFEHKGERVQPRSRTFIPARLKDNPYLVNTGYAAVLQAMPEPLRSMMLNGDFRAGIQDDPWQVIPTEWIKAAQARWVEGGRGDRGLDSVGVDVARGGKDQTVLARRYGVWYAPLEKHPGTATPSGQAVAGLVLVALQEGGGAVPSSPTANVDVIGVGASVYDHLVEHGASVSPINFAAKSEATDRAGVLHFANLRAEAYWGLREALDPVKGDGLCLPPDSELLSDLAAPKWSVRLSGIQVEAKEDIVKRIGRSPDSGDAVVLASIVTSPSLFAWGGDDA